QRAAMQLEIHLAYPDRELGFAHLCVDGHEPLRDVDRSKLRQRRKIIKLTLPLDHLLSRTAATVAIAEGQQAFRMEVLSAKVPPGFVDGARTDLGIVAADRVVEGVRKHP